MEGQKEGSQCLNTSAKLFYCKKKKKKPFSVGSSTQKRRNKFPKLQLNFLKEIVKTSVEANQTSTVNVEMQL